MLTHGKFFYIFSIVLSYPQPQNHKALMMNRPVNVNYRDTCFNDFIQMT